MQGAECAWFNETCNCLRGVHPAFVAMCKTRNACNGDMPSLPDSFGTSYPRPLCQAIEVSGAESRNRLPVPCVWSTQREAVHGEAPRVSFPPQVVALIGMHD